MDAYDAIDTQVEENQEAINVAFEQTLAAYKAELLPEEDQMALGHAIDSVFNAQVAGLKAAGFYPQFQVGPNGFVVEVDEDYSPTGLKQITADEKMLLPFAGASDD